MPPPMTGFITCSPTGAGSCLSPQRATKYFIGEIPGCVIDLVTYVYGEMAFREHPQEPSVYTRPIISSSHNS
jgi:hypothetical protein